MLQKQSKKNDLCTWLLKINTFETVLKIDLKGACRFIPATGYLLSTAISIDGPVPSECP
jgi:hypothetical protein